ncbi:hypothetical protein AQ490_14325 [Wenjunlia vitaminophila]|uniref:HTH luxR-type domain-containing protein n=1 Tax=Wenjunlia vitaminophila TaxID=76728 RepID=A0A0T6LVY9_WENVI|nr:LuxR family transcriptional regulator [Wenjunlia vitaminophila]KRV50286.1 hypothetical protein AQ490_14325 [Wenjunlia vitaminophila]
MRIVEREEEIATLDDLLATASRGSGGCVMIRGEAGSGKTELLCALGERAAEAGFLVVTATTSRAERQVAGSAIAQLLRHPSLPWRPGCQVSALLDRLNSWDQPESESTPGGPSNMRADTAAFLHQLSAKMVETAASQPLLICLDGVQYADPLSMHWLFLMLRWLRTTRVALVLTECQTMSPGLPELHAELLRQPNYRCVDLGRLSRDGVREMLAERFDPARAEALATEYHTHSGGVPLLVRALIDDGFSGADGTGAVIGRSFRNVVLSWVERGGPVPVRLTQVLAVLDGEEGSPGLVRRLLSEDDPGLVDRWVGALRSVGVLDGYRIRHAELRADILRALTPQELSDLHMSIAELRYQDGATAVVVSRHLLAAEQAPGPWALPVLRRAAEWLLAANRHADAYACLDMALRVSDEDARPELLAMLADVAWLQNPLLAARHLPELSTALRENRLPDERALPLTKFLMWHGYCDEAIDVLCRITRRNWATNTAVAAEARLITELFVVMHPRPSRGVPYSRTRPQREVDGGPRFRCISAWSRVLSEGPDDALGDEVVSAMRNLQLEENSHSSIYAAVLTLQFVDRPEEALTWCERWLNEARVRSVPTWEAKFLALRGRLALRLGDPRAARAYVEACFARIPAEGWGVAVGEPISCIVQAATHTGDYAAASSYLDMPVPDMMFRTWHGLGYLYARGRHHLAAGRPDAALGDLMWCGALMREWGIDQPAVIPWRTEASRAHLLLGDRERAAELAREQLAMLPSDRPHPRGLALHALAAASDPRDSADLMAEAIEVFRARGDRLRLVQALGDLGRLHYLAGNPDRARPVVRLAARLAEECGAGATLGDLPIDPAPLEDGCQRSRHMAQHPCPAAAPLSGAERRVAALAARGLTNREISEQLCITISTVEQHLTRIYRKLAIKSRENIPGEILLESVGE